MANESQFVIDTQQSVADTYQIDLPSIKKYKSNLNTFLASSPTSRTVPSSIFQSALLAKQDISLVPPLETLSFDQIAKISEINDLNIEYNLDECVRLLRVCSATFSTYADLAKLYLETRMRAEEFFKLDAVRIEEVENGLYELPHKEAEADYKAATYALQYSQKQESLIKSLIQDSPTEAEFVANGVVFPGSFDYKTVGLLGGPYMSKYAEFAYFANIDRNIPQLPVGNIKLTNNQSTAAYVSRMATHNISMTRASWDLSLNSAISTSYQVSQKKDFLEVKVEYAKKDIRFKTDRAAISRDLAYRQLHEHTREDSIINYGIRLGRTKVIYDKALTLLCQRVKSVIAGTKSVYKIDIPIIASGPVGLLEDISMWIIIAQEKLSSISRNESISISSIFLNDKIIPNIISDLGNGLVFPFQIDSGKTKGFLRGVSAEFVGKRIAPLSLDIGFTKSTQSIFNIKPEDWRYLKLGRVTNAAVGLAVQPEHRDMIWNFSTDVYFTVKLNSENLDLSEISDIILYFWVART